MCINASQEGAADSGHALAAQHESRMYRLLHGGSAGRFIARIRHAALRTMARDTCTPGTRAQLAQAPVDMHPASQGKQATLTFLVQVRAPAALANTTASFRLRGLEDRASTEPACMGGFTCGFQSGASVPFLGQPLGGARLCCTCSASS